MNKNKKMRTKNFLFLCLTLSFMILSCNKVEDVLIPNQEFEAETWAGKSEGFKTLYVNSINLPCVSDHKFVIKAEIDNNDIKLEYLRNSASASLNTPTSINWTISGGNILASPSGSSSDFAFMSDANYMVNVVVNNANNTTDNIGFCISTSSLSAYFDLCSNNEMFMDDCESYAELISTPKLALKSISSPTPTSSSILGGSFAIILDD